MRSKPQHAAELTSQVLMGTPLTVGEKQGDWWHAESPDGYNGWINNSSLTLLSENEMKKWRSAKRAIVTSLSQVNCYDNPDKTNISHIVSDLVNGDIVEIKGQPNPAGFQEIILPDGRNAWVETKAIMDLDKWAQQQADPNRIIMTASSMMGQPYLWGGTSVKGVDCSGLVKISFLSNGFILPRDASQQAAIGHKIKAEDWRQCRPGDLLFFGIPRSGKVTHVGIYIGDGKYIHSSGRVKRNSIDPLAPDYLSTPFLHAARIIGHEESKGIKLLKNHSWYFNL